MNRTTTNHPTLQGATPMNRTRRTLTVGATLTTAGSAVLLLATAGSTAAHVSASPSEAPAGASTVIELSTSHGCDGSPTTQIAVEIPEGVLSVRPTVVAGWEIEVVEETLAEPIDDGHGGQMTERTASVTYTAVDEPLEDGLRQVWPISMKMPDAPGTTVHLPVVQTCEVGETAWITIAADGAEEPETPAPSVALVAAAIDAEPVAATDGDDADGTGLAIAALVVGGLGLAVGGAALARGRSRS
jgi:uncharacterized protein YcnI